MHAFSPRAADIRRRDDAERLRQLSDEVNRIAATLSHLSASPSRSAEVVSDGDDLPLLSIDTIRNVIRARRLRGRYFPNVDFADPAWDMLLDLLRAEHEQHRVSVSSLTIAAAVPATTALRWIKKMVGEGILVRKADPYDGRRVFVELDPKASLAMQRYFAEIEVSGGFGAA